MPWICAKLGVQEVGRRMRTKGTLLFCLLLGSLAIAACDIPRGSRAEVEQPVLDYSWVATVPRAELVGHFDRANVFMAAEYYRRQQGYASGEIPRLLPSAYTSHPLAYYTLRREAATSAAPRANVSPSSELAARHFARGLNFYDLGDFHSAIEEFSRAIQFDTRHARAYAFRALSFGYTGDTASAEADLRSAIRLEADPLLIAEVRQALAD